MPFRRLKSTLSTENETLLVVFSQQDHRSHKTKERKANEELKKNREKEKVKEKDIVQDTEKKEEVDGEADRESKSPKDKEAEKEARALANDTPSEWETATTRMGSWSLNWAKMFTGRFELGY